MSEERSDFVPDPDLSASVRVADTPLTVSRVEAPVEAEEKFEGDVERDIDGLLYLGALSATVNIWGHRFEIHTLRAGEELARDQIVNEYDGMFGQSRALGLATAAAAVKSVDGTALQRPLAPGKSDVISAIRANFVTFSNYYFPVIERIYDEYELLELRQARAFRALEGK